MRNINGRRRKPIRGGALSNLKDLEEHFVKAIALNKIAETLEPTKNGGLLSSEQIKKKFKI